MELVSEIMTLEQKSFKPKNLKKREVQISKLVHNYYVNTFKNNYHLMGFTALVRACALHTRLFRLFNTQNSALRAPTPPIAASLILPAKLMIYRENPAKNPSLVKMLVYSVSDV